MNSITCSIFFHNYYGQHEDWIQFFSQKMNVPFILYYNVVEDSMYNLEQSHLLGDRLQKAASGPWLKKIVLRRSPNQGKDIGGKLVLLDAALRENEDSEYGIFLHDKKSPYKIQNQEWKDQLFRIVEPAFVQRALAAFSKDQKIGVIAGTDSIRNEYDPATQSFISQNRSLLARLQSENNIVTNDYRYVAGTMFWVRRKPLLDFFTEHPPLDIRKTFERGNVMDDNHGTYAHSWERLMTWLIFTQGYTIKGI